MSVQLMACIAVASCSGDKAPNKVPPLRPGIVLSDSLRSLESGQTSTRFQLPALRDLFVRVQVADRPPSPTMLELVFINPNGERFFEDRSLYSLDPAVRTLDDPTLGPATRVFTIKSIPGGYALDRELSIAGTIFTRVPVPDGDWTVRATIAGTPGTLTTTLRLTWAR